MATAFGVKACIVTTAGPEANLTVFDRHELHIVSTEETLTFEHSYTWWGKSCLHPVHPRRSSWRILLPIYNIISEIMCAVNKMLSCTHKTMHLLRLVCIPAAMWQVCTHNMPAARHVHHAPMYTYRNMHMYSFAHMHNIQQQTPALTCIQLQTKLLSH